MYKSILKAAVVLALCAAAAAAMMAQDMASSAMLAEDREAAARFSNLVPGEWVLEDTAKDEEDANVNAVNRKVFTFYRDGRVKLEESKIGQSTSFFKEDWLFMSYGTYGYRGDTINLYINRFHAVRQIFSKAKRDSGKIIWIDEPGPTFDSTITDGSQDRSITYEDLTTDFKRTKEF